MRTVAIIIINRDRPDLTDQVVEQVRDMALGLEKRLYVVECGSKKPAGCSKYMTHWFRDPNYRGRYYGFNRALEIARRDRPADYYWFLCNDITFPEGQDALTELIGAMEEDPRMGLIGPGEPDAEDYQGCHPKPGRRWHSASTVHGLAHLIRGEVIHSIGYMNPKFRYSQGAGTEYAYKLNCANWFLAYSDIATVQHAGTSTYGTVVKISRHEYLRRARNFASKYLRKTYGENWDERFTAALPADVEVNMYPQQRKIWEQTIKRNPKEICPWFWKLGSRIKRITGF